jgi:hypothetical protein
MISRLICISLLLTGSTVLTPTRLSEDETRESVSKITYRRDSQTGLCFAFLSSQSSYGHLIISFTNIPCEKMPK